MTGSPVTNHLGEDVMTIGINTLDKSAALLKDLLVSYLVEIDKAYNEYGDDSFPVNMKLTFTPSNKGGVDIKADISFVTGRVKDTTKGSVDENQIPLELHEKEG